MKMGMAAGEARDNSCLYGAAAYGLVLCNPVGVINSGYLAQSEGIWNSTANNNSAVKVMITAALPN